MPQNDSGGACRGGYVMVLLLGGWPVAVLNVRCEEILHGAVLLFVAVIVCGRWSVGKISAVCEDIRQADN